MSDRRFDVRTQAQFASDIKHSTMVEKYIFERWAAVAHETSKIKVLSWQSNGCDNTGEFLPTGTNTAGADYKATVDTPLGRFDVPIEVKLCPLYDFFTLKARDLVAYANEGAAILFVMPMIPSSDLRMSGGLSLDERIAMLEDARLEWGVMWQPAVSRLAGWKMEPQKCFGGKAGVRIYRDRYHEFFRLYPLRRKSV